MLGDLLSTNDRSKLVISSKAGTTLARASIAPTSREHAKDFSPDWIEESCRRSIDNLRCQYLDIFYLHGIEYTEITDDLLTRLERMRRDGMFQYLGINTHRELDMRWMTERADSFDVALIDYNLLQLDREPIITQLHQSGIGVIAGTVLAQGHLVKGKIGSLRSQADAWYLLRALLKGSGRRLLRSSGAMRNALSEVPNMSPAQASFSYVLRNDAVASCVFGTTRIANLEAVADAPDLELSDEVCHMLRSTYERQGTLTSM